MNIVILGAGTAIPATQRSPAGIYVHTGAAHLLFDAGAGSLQRLQRIGVTLLDLDRVFLTHYHIDHCLDLASVLFAMRLPRLGRSKPLFVYGPRGLARLYRELDHAFHGWMTPLGYRLILKELGATTIRLARGTVTARRMNHYDTGALGYRLSVGGKILAYSGDTDQCRNIIELGKGADVLILECSVPDEEKVAGHLTPSECGRVAAETGCRHLVLTHFYPVFNGYDIRGRVRRAFRGRLTLAKDFTRLTV